MGKGRLEAFSDGVIAIIITIMVLELKVPHGDGWATLLPLAPVMLSYVLSFTYVGIYWNKLQYGCYPLFFQPRTTKLSSPSATNV
jgi:uncharacterized membrane protein